MQTPPLSQASVDAALCPHFGPCGGCQHQDLSYDAQLAAKGIYLEKLFDSYWTAPIPITPSPEVWHYRNKVDFTFGRKWYDSPPPSDFERESVLGFKQKGRWYAPLEIQTCLIAPEGTETLLAAVRAWMDHHGYGAFDSRTGEGLLKVLLVRVGKRTGERMVVLVTRPGDIDDESFVQTVEEVYPATSIYRGIHHGTADVADADELRLFCGEPAIEEELHVSAGDDARRLRMRISPFSFFQTNTLATEQLYAHIRDWVRSTRPSRLYDLYGGAGTIAITCADVAEHVVSVDNVPSAVDDGQHNLALNSVENVEFHCEKMKNYLRSVVQDGGMPAGSAAVVDPPRSGLTPKARRRLIESAPENLLYVSCNPKLLAQELPEFLEAYELIDLRAVDLFPHTRHVEAVASLRRKRFD